MRTFFVTLLASLIFLAAADAGFSQTSQSEEKVTAIQDKIFHRYHELSAVSGYMGDDYFYDALPVGLSYTYNFDDHYSWEVARAYLYLTSEKNLKNELETGYGATPENFDEPKALLLSHFVVRPFYGKDSVWNKSILNHETFFFLGGGVEVKTKNYSYNSPADEITPVVSLGAGIKYFVNENFNVSFEVHDLLSTGGEFENRVWFGVNVGFRFNFSERKAPSNTMINKLSAYITE